MLELAAITTVIKTTKKLISIIPIVKWLIHRFEKSRAKATHIRTLFGFLEDADITTGNTPIDDIDSLKLFKSWMLHYFRRDRRITYTDEGMYPDLSKHLCTIGGPVDHPFTRYAMGYNFHATRWNRVLPFILPLAKAAAKQQKIIRKWKTETWYVRPWFIGDRDGRPKFIPQTDRNGVLNKDYLMLLVVPNTFTEDAFYTGQKHMIFVPVHGLAQLAVKDILDNASILEQLIKIRHESEYFQAIIEVQAKLTRHGYAPSGDFFVIKCEPLDAGDFTRFPRFHEWPRI